MHPQSAEFATLCRSIIYLTLCYAFMTVRTRFAPSPTGYLHIGGARTALFCWLYARRHQGQFILRVEDTDRERSTDESVQAILDGMQWLGLDADEGPFYQTKRFDRYREIVEQLLAQGDAYYCYCSPEELQQMRDEAMQRKEKPRYNGYWRDRDDAPPEGVKPVVRFRNPLDGSVVIEDMVKGRIEISNAELDDLVIMRSDGTPTYNLTVVVDDFDMNITHVIRGDDHINNTPRQINILKALGASLPAYAHLPMILGEDKKRLSKRHGAVSVLQYKEDGYLPQGLLNYLVRLGWSHEDQEIFSIDEMVQLFSLEAVNKSGSVFNSEKLDWVNQQHFLSLPADELGKAFEGYVVDKSCPVEAYHTVETSSDQCAAVAELQKDRCNTLKQMAEESTYFFFESENYDPKAAAKQLTDNAVEPLQLVGNKLAALAEAGQWQPDQIDAAIKATVEELGIGFGKLGLPLRVALTGNTKSPSLEQTVFLIGQESVARRLARALDVIAAG